MVMSSSWIASLKACSRMNSAIDASSVGGVVAYQSNVTRVRSCASGITVFVCIWPM